MEEGDDSAVCQSEMVDGRHIDGGQRYHETKHHEDEGRVHVEEGGLGSLQRVDDTLGVGASAYLALPAHCGTASGSGGEGGVGIEVERRHACSSYKAKKEGERKTCSAKRERKEEQETRRAKELFVCVCVCVCFWVCVYLCLRLVGR